MIKVKNHKIISKLSTRSLKASRQKNLILICAIALTTLLFTSLFTIGGSMLKTVEMSTCRQVGTMAHGGFKYLSQEEYDTLRKQKLIKKSACSIVMATAENKELSKMNVEMRYAEDEYAAWGFSQPSTGRMPQSKDEVAVSTIILDAFDVEHKLGETLSFSYHIGDKAFTDTFKVCGFWEGDGVAKAQMAWLSKEFVTERTPVPKVAGEERNVYGFYSLDVWFSNSWDINGKMYEVIKASGFHPEDMNIGVNWAYGSATVDIQSILLVGMVLVLIVVAGYLVIYNIFYISVVKDIRFYGLLKTIGTTGRQIRSMVKRQAFLLSVFGIPIGWLFGWFIGKLLLPVMIDVSYYRGQSEVSISPWIFLAATLFSLLTIYISARKPAKIAGKVSPMEALRYNEVSTEKKHIKQTKKVSIVHMAFRNVFRSKKKVVAVLLSLLLCMVLLQSIYTMVRGFDLDKFVEESVIADFDVADATLLHRNETIYLSDEVKQQISSIEGITKSSYVYMSENVHQITDVIREKLSAKTEEYRKLGQAYGETLEWILKSGIMQSHIYGIDQYLFDKLCLIDGELDFEKFASGDYIYITTYEWYIENGGERYYDVGDKVTIDFDNGKKKEYTVLGVVEYPSTASCQHYHMPNSTFILSSKEYEKQLDDTSLIHILFDVDKNKVEETESILSNLCDDSGLDYVSRKSMEKEFSDMIHMFLLVGGALTFILGMIGVLNFMNTILTSMISRRRELAMLQSIGMTTRQLRSMLVCEGLIYAGITMIAAVTIGNAITVAISSLLEHQIWFFSYHFTMMPILICGPVLVVISVIIPYVCYHFAVKKSVVERLRAAE